MTQILIILFVATLLVGVPVAFTMGMAGLGAILISGDPTVSPLIATQKLFNGINSLPLMAVPFFILASELMTAFGLTSAIIRFANNLVGHLRGGLGHVNVLVSMFFAGISGSALADAAGPSAVAMRMMRKSGYDANYSGALSAATATIGPIIPPSILMVVYAISESRVTVTGLFLAGVLPGILLGGALAIANHIVSVRRDYRGREHRATLREVGASGLSAAPALFMPFLILGGILGGAFTPTEAGAAASAYALLLALFLGKLRAGLLSKVFVRAAVTTSSVLLIVSMASIFAWLLTIQQIPQEIAAIVTAVTDDKIAALLIMAAFILLCGLFIDTLPALIILTPILAPVAAHFGVDPRQFAMMLILNLAIGMVTPPVGPVLFVISTVGRIRIESLSRAILPLLAAEVAVLLLIIFVPEISTAIPDYFGYMH